jgi:hypothetical protein
VNRHNRPPQRNGNTRIALCGKGANGKSAITNVRVSEIEQSKGQVLVVDSHGSNSCLYQILDFDKELCSKALDHPGASSGGIGKGGMTRGCGSQLGLCLVK